MAGIDEEDTFENARLRLLDSTFLARTCDANHIKLIQEALATGCPDAFCGRFDSCGLCWLANELGVFERLRDAKPDWLEED